MKKSIQSTMKNISVKRLRGGLLSCINPLNKGGVKFLKIHMKNHSFKLNFKRILMLVGNTSIIRQAKLQGQINVYNSAVYLIAIAINGTSSHYIVRTLFVLALSRKKQRKEDERRIKEKEEMDLKFVF